MPRLDRIYTKTGDEGTTGLGGGRRVPKDSLRVTAYGTVDELNSLIGVALAAGLCDRLTEELTLIQNELFDLGSDLCWPSDDERRARIPTVEPRQVEKLERLIDEFNDAVGPLTSRARNGTAGPGGGDRRLRPRLPQSPVGRTVRHGALREPRTGRGRTALAARTLGRPGPGERHLGPPLLRGPRGDPDLAVGDLDRLGSPAHLAVVGPVWRERRGHREGHDPVTPDPS